MKTSNLAEVYIQENAAMRGAKPELSLGMKQSSKRLVVAPVPAGWGEAASWRLPSGKALAEFALQAGFVAPLLFGPESFARGLAARAPHRSTGPGKAGRP